MFSIRAVERFYERLLGSNPGGFRARRYAAMTMVVVYVMLVAALGVVANVIW